MIHSNHIKVQDHSDLVRDSSTSAILNINSEELKKHRARKSLIQSKEVKLNELSSRVDSLENMVKNLLNNYNKDITE